MKKLDIFVVRNVLVVKVGKDVVYSLGVDFVDEALDSEIRFIFKGVLHDVVERKKIAVIRRQDRERTDDARE